MKTDVALADLAAHLDELLEVAAVEDYGPNGIQVEGRERVGKVVTGVSACQELFERAADAGADAVLVHHGLFWQGMPYPLTGVTYRRVAALVRNELSLLAYHLPLDRHPELGNNALAARRLGLKRLQPFGRHQGVAIGFQGIFPEPLPFAELVARCRELFDQEPLALGDGPGEVQRVGIISGGAQKELHQAIAAGLEVYITGEASEWVTNLAREAGIHYLAAGHYATERLGVQALGEHLAERFGIETEFLDVPNPV
ncbi:MAG TPA: Nif3-like dinuclear metal center hexameric protein [Thermoanaerobaculia bacterium]|nr:Nif3-like dinuclear metal center hexameric protein [Thermoanaerobaculia bacterium]